MHTQSHTTWPAARPHTASQIISNRRKLAIVRVIRHMRGNLQRVLDLETVAEIACCSRYHLVRIFAEQTGVTPMNFLSSLRIQAAKSALLHTDEKVINVAYDVGYSSLGSFGRRFNDLVGLSPRALRKGARQFDEERFWRLLDEFASRAEALEVPNALSGDIRVAIGTAGPGYAYVGIFEGNQPSGMPISCTLARYPGQFRLRSPLPRSGPGKLVLLAAAMPCSGDPRSMLLSRELMLSRTALEYALPGKRLSVALTQQSETDPPVLLALPLLLQARMKPQPSAATMAGAA